MSSMPYLKGDAPSQLDVFVPKITRAYITSRLESGEWGRLGARAYGGGRRAGGGGRGDGHGLQTCLGSPPYASSCLPAHQTLTLRCSHGACLPAHVCSAAVQAVVVQGAAEDPLDNDEQLQVLLGSVGEWFSRPFERGCCVWVLRVQAPACGQYRSAFRAWRCNACPGCWSPCRTPGPL